MTQKTQFTVAGVVVAVLLLVWVGIKSAWGNAQTWRKIMALRRSAADPLSFGSRSPRPDVFPAAEPGSYFLSDAVTLISAACFVAPMS